MFFCGWNFTTPNCAHTSTLANGWPSIGNDHDLKLACRIENVVPPEISFSVAM